MIKWQRPLDFTLVSLIVHSSNEFKISKHVSDKQPLRMWKGYKSLRKSQACMQQKRARKLPSPCVCITCHGPLIQLIAFFSWRVFEQSMWEEELTELIYEDCLVKVCSFLLDMMRWVNRWNQIFNFTLKHPVRSD